MPHVQCVRTQGYGIAIRKPSGGCENFCVGKLKHAALIRQAINPKLIARVRANDG
jgi:hypothetical protein